MPHVVKVVATDELAKQICNYGEMKTQINLQIYASGRNINREVKVAASKIITMTFDDLDLSCGLDNLNWAR